MPREVQVQAGKLRHRLALQTRTTTRGPQGQVIETWTTESTRWAAIEPLAGRELIQAQQTQARVTHKITLRYYDGLTTEYRGLKGSKVYHFESVLPALGMEGKVEILATETVGAT